MEQEKKKKLNLKIIIAVVIAIILIVTICICVNSKKSVKVANEPVYLELTSDMIEEIKEEMNDEIYFDVAILANKQLFKNALGSDYTYTSLEVTNQKKTDKYTYTIYAIAYYKDNYNKKGHDEMTIRYKAEEDKTTEKGYTLKRTVN